MHPVSICALVASCTCNTSIHCAAGRTGHRAEGTGSAARSLKNLGDRVLSCQIAGGPEAGAGGDRRRRNGRGAQKEDPAGAARHAVDHCLQCAPAHETAVRKATLQLIC